MNKSLVIGLILFAVASISAGTFFLIKGNKSGDTLTLYKDLGTVSYKTESEEYIAIDSEKKAIPNRSFVKTGADGLAHVILPNGSMISLAENTEMQINYTSEKIDVLQTLGNAWYRIKKLTGAEFNVETPTAVAAVRGTIFGVERIGSEDVVYVTQNTVEIAQLKEEGGQKVRQESQTVSENKLANIGSVDKGAPQIIDLPDAKKQSPWFRRNQIIDKEYEEGIKDDFIKNLHDNSEIQQIDVELQFQRNSGATLGESDFSQMFNYSWLQNSQEACGYINSAEYAQAIAELRSAGLGAWGDWLVKAVDLYQNACKDGVIDISEVQEIQNFYQTQPQPAFTVPQY